KIIENLKDFLKPSLARFDEEKKQSTLTMLQKVADCEGRRNSKQDEFLSKVSPYFNESPEPERKW
ncbi:MAG: hypothetical protein OEZ51_03280, partial [Nitrospinota bacterium]|nr:hypothetical protein [Nitrospinota bacterium]